MNTPDNIKCNRLYLLLQDEDIEQKLKLIEFNNILNSLQESILNYGINSITAKYVIYILVFSANNIIKLISISQLKQIHSLFPEYYWIDLINEYMNILNWSNAIPHFFELFRYSSKLSSSIKEQYKQAFKEYLIVQFCRNKLYDLEIMGVINTETLHITVDITSRHNEYIENHLINLNNFYKLGLIEKENSINIQLILQKHNISEYVSESIFHYIGLPMY